MNRCLILLLLGTATSVRWEESCSAEDGVGARVAALIPARDGSKGIRRKNLSRIGNETLLARALRRIRQSGQFGSVWVSTDGREIAAEAVDHGGRVHWRDPATATDEASTLSAVKDFLRYHPEVDVLAVVQCTSPFLRPEFLTSALRKMTNNSLDCVFAVTRVFNLRWIESADGFAKAVNFDPKKRPRRQDWEGELIENGMFYIFKTELVTRHGVLQNDRCGVLEIPRRYSLEIDDESDLLTARELSRVMDAPTTEEQTGGQPSREL
ncbi:UNVERIFIED_CONTAM: hypothetical protein PYX00_001015 [Menopon gallinae]|uniref:N-acylneuraminate cytidylyltransferase n=1 Tax=Menopon gallinae TaxID=328185 RepID=A0AAW2IBZ9_9NEOP